jgi:acetoacetyl-CoA synthetase
VRGGAGEPLWTPPDGALERSNLGRYLNWMERERGLRFADYQAAWQWSVDDVDGFWSSVWDYFDVQASTAPTSVRGRRTMPGTEWFPGARLNFAEHVFRDRDPAGVALVHESELRPLGETTWGELEAEVGRVAAGLRALGVQPGDRVAAYLPNVPETLVAFLACAVIGAIWSVCSPDFGAPSVVERFTQIEPKVLIAVDGYRYGGRDFDLMDVLPVLRSEIGSLEQTILLPYLHPDRAPAELGPDVLAWSALAGDGPAELSFEQLPFDHPLWVVYSSGTTGLPKPIVHGHGGVLLEHLKHAHLHLDLQAGDRVFWFTTSGWAMWNILLSALLTPAAMVLYDGSPAVPDLGRLWDLAAQTGVTCFGTSAAFVATCMKAGLEPGRDHDLGAVRSVGSTGSPLSAEGFRWIYEHVADDVWLFSMSGGTDVATAFIGGVPTLPVYAGELQVRCLGAKVEAWDPEGRPLTGQVGELVLPEPMPSMPLFLWNDAGGERYRDSYFDMYPGVWRHGDWIEINDRGGSVISGRSDATINRSGIRIGTSEIYRSVLTLDEVLDALVVDLPRPGADGSIVLFVVLATGARLDDELRASIARRIRSRCSPRHVPDEVRVIAEVPRTLSGKIVEVPVKRILMGTPPAEAISRDALANPDALAPFLALAPASPA